MRTLVNERKRQKRWRNIFIAFIAATVFMYVAVISADLVGFQAYQGRTNENKSFIQLKIGEKLLWTEALSEEQTEHLSEVGSGYLFHEQTAESLVYVSDDVHDKNAVPKWSETPVEDRTVFVDSDGYINAAQTGIYKLTYVIRALNDASPEYSKKTYEFVNYVAVYASDEDRYRPLQDYDDPSGNYILTQDIDMTTEYSALKLMYEEPFTGVLVNPYGYTVTVGYTETERYPALFGENRGIIDGLKVHYERTEERTAYLGNFSALVEQNYGLLQNCEVTGDVAMLPGRLSYTDEYNNEYMLDGEAGLLPQEGFVLNNKVAMRLYTDGTVYAYKYANPSIPVAISQSWDIRGNEVAVDCYFYTDVLKCRSRNVRDNSTSVWEKEDDNTCTRLDGSRPYDSESKITFKFPRAYGEYYTYETRVQNRSVIEFNKDGWYDVLYDSPIANDWNFRLTDVQYWLVNGEKYETLTDFVVTKNLEIEPCVKYRDFCYGSQVDNKCLTLTRIMSNEDGEVVITLDKILELWAGAKPEVASSVFSADLFESFFADPRNVLPEKIVIGAEFAPKVDGVFTEAGAVLMNTYLQNGGVLEVESGNGSLLLLNKKYLCSADGNRLIRYFHSAEEKSVTLPERFSQLSSKAFIEGNVIEELNVEHVSAFDIDALVNCTLLKSVAFGRTVNVSNFKYGNTASFDQLMQKLKTVTSVTVAAENDALHAEDNFVWNDSGKLVYYVPTATGEVTVPDGIVSLGDNAFCASEISTLIFPDSLTYFNSVACRNMEKLERIIFGNPEYLICTTVGFGNVPALKEVVFGREIKYLNLAADMFKTASLGVVVLPEALEELGNMFVDCTRFEIASSNPYFKTVNGVLYNKDGTELICYPVSNGSTAFVVPEGVTKINGFAFSTSALEEVVLPETLTTIGKFAFNQNVQLKKVTAKSTDVLEIEMDAFVYSSALTDFELPSETATLSVGESAFYYCTALKNFPDVKTVQLYSSAFKESGLETFTFGNELSILQDGVFKGSMLKKAVFPDGYAGEASGNLFLNCTQLEEVYLGGVTAIGKGTFEGSAIKELRSENVKTIGITAFKNAGSLTKAEFPKAETVGAYAFEACGALQTLTLAEKISVGEKSFFGCQRLKELPSVIVGIESETFPSLTFYDCKSIEKLSFAFTENDDEHSFMSSNELSTCTALKELSFECGYGVSFASGYFSELTNLEKVTIKYERTGGMLSTAAFGGLKQELSLYLDVPSDFSWSGQVPKPFTLYVPEEFLETFAENWLAEETQFVGYTYE